MDSNFELEDALDIYLDLRLQIKRLEDQVKPVKEWIEQKMSDESVKLVETGEARFFLKRRETWEYADGVKNQIEALKRRAQENGMATTKTCNYLSYQLMDESSKLELQ